MQIRVNGKSIELDTPLSLAEFLQKYGIDLTTSRVAIALNERIAFRTEWGSLIVRNGDRIEIIHAVQGG
jgi:sulfur carrier protein